ncbi:UNVERIFIED_CONTAM: hypothetical protein GTU68_010392 [Idotea baltica]|nr:hypothetical protein [Idotea baltica]
MRIGIFGGSFDPIHQGHLILAERCRAEANLDEVWFLLCATNPLKSNGANGTDRQRCEMVELAIAGHEGFKLSKIELERGGVSYTVETLQQISDERPDDELFFLMGDDSLEGFDRWKEPEKICQLCLPLIVNRPGSGVVDLSVLEKYVDADRFKLIQQLQVTSPMVDISSREIRSRIAADKSVRYLLPRAVQRYIETQGLYQAPVETKG